MSVVVFFTRLREHQFLGGNCELFFVRSWSLLAHLLGSYRAPNHVRALHISHTVRQRKAGPPLAPVPKRRPFRDQRANLGRSIPQQFAADAGAGKVAGWGWVDLEVPESAIRLNRRRIRDYARGVFPLEQRRRLTRASPGLPQLRDHVQNPIVS
jgi:hypothetical protein